MEMKDASEQRNNGTLVHFTKEEIERLADPSKPYISEGLVIDPSYFWSARRYAAAFDGAGDQVNNEQATC